MKKKKCILRVSITGVMIAVCIAAVMTANGDKSFALQKVKAADEVLEDVKRYDEEPSIKDEDHTHEPEQKEQTVLSSITDYGRNTRTTIYFSEGKSYTFADSKSSELIDLLSNLEYDQGKICKCLPEYKVNAELENEYGINLSDGYARCDKGQAELTEEQINIMKEIIEWAEDKAE